MPETAKKFVDEIFTYFETISIDKAEHSLCSYKKWQSLNYHCTSFKKKYVIAYLSLQNEMTICDFVVGKLLKD